MSKELFEKRNKLTYDLRLALDKWEADNNKPTGEFDLRANSLLKEQVERLEKDLDQVESQLSRNAVNEKHAKREAELAKPQFDTRSKNFIQPQDDYTKRFAKELFSGNRIGLDRLMAERTAVTTIDGDVSGAVPVEWQNRIVEKINQFNVMRQVCPVRNVLGDQKIVIGGALPNAVKMTEGTAITEDTAFTVSNVDVLDLTYGCFVPVSKQYATDAIGGLEYVARKAGEAIANKLEDEYTNGAGGSGNMPGLLSNTFDPESGAVVDSGTTTLALWAALANQGAADSLIDLAHSVAAPYRPGAAYMMSDAVAKTVRKLKGGDGQYLWKNPENYSDIRDGMPSTIYGFPVYINTTMETAPGAGETFVVFGNFNFYEIYDRDGGANVFIDPYGLSTALTTRVIVSHRTYGVCTNLKAFNRLTI
jgi:HK97 family phage major capsid protein